MTERGRSLTEMLGTLSIMGILSVVGVWMYHSVVDKNRTNELIEEAQKRAVVVAGQIGFNGHAPSLAEFSPYNETSGGTFESQVYYTDKGLYKQFGIKVKDVDKVVCQNLLNTIGDTTPIRRLSLEGTPTTPLTTCEDSNTFLIVYNEDMKGVKSDTEYAIDDSSCKSVCGVFNPTTHLCDESDCEIPTNTCVENADCNSKNECMVCDIKTNMCKNGCERVQYLESTGTQYIDTGLDYFADYEVGIKLRDNVANKALGNTHANCMQRCSVTTPFWCFSSNNNYYSEVSITEYHVMKWKEDKIYADDVLLREKVKSKGTTSMTLFGAGSYYPNMIYFCKLWNPDDGTLVRDFVPVKSPKGNCMLNKVADSENGKLKLYCNSGSGTFKTNKD